MSLSFQPLNSVLVRDPRTIVDNARDYAILKSGSQTFWKTWTSTSISPSSIQWSVPPPSAGVFVDRKIYVYLPVRLTFMGIPPVGQTILQANRDAPRAYPISSALDVLRMTVNNHSMSINLGDIIHALLHYNTDHKLKNLDYSMTPNCPDQSQQYGDLFNSIRSPLQSYGDSLDETVMGRGGFNFTVFANPVQTVVGATITAIIDCAFCEPLWLSPLYFGHCNGSAFFNVNSMDFDFTFFNQAANRMWSHDDQGGLNPITSSSIAFGGTIGGPTTIFKTGQGPLLLIQYITPQESQILSPNMPITYSYFDVQRYPTQWSPIAPGVTTTIPSNNIQLNSIPRRFYIYVRDSNQSLFSTPSLTDTYFSIENISIQFMAKNGLLASASKLQLYEMSVKNHCNMSWTQWSGGPVNVPGTIGTPSLFTIGSIACIEFATDIGLDSLDAPGKLQQVMLQVDVTCTNISSRSITPTLYLVPILEGTFVIEGIGRAVTQIGVISSKDILDAQSRPGINYRDIQCVNGGDFFSGLRDFGRKLVSGIETFINNKGISKTLKAIPNPLAQVSGVIADNLGYGNGGVVVGGRHMGRHAIKHRMRNY